MILSLTLRSSGNLCDLAVPAEGEEKDSHRWLVLLQKMVQTSSVAHWLDEEDFRGNGGVMNHETAGELWQIVSKPFTVDYTGFGWVHD